MTLMVFSESQLHRARIFVLRISPKAILQAFGQEAQGHKKDNYRAFWNMQTCWCMLQLHFNHGYLMLHDCWHISCKPLALTDPADLLGNSGNSALFKMWHGQRLCFDLLRSLLQSGQWYHTGHTTCSRNLTNRTTSLNLSISSNNMEPGNISGA